MRKTYQIMGYPSGVTDGPALVLAAENDQEATEKAIALLRQHGCNVLPETLSVSVDKPRLLERWP